MRITMPCLLVALLAASAWSATLNVGPGETYTTIQSAIDASSDGDVINVYPGTYAEAADGPRDPEKGGTGSNLMNLFVDKSVTIQGVNASGSPITGYSAVEATVSGAEGRPTFGQSSIFVQADGVTITGLQIDPPPGPNKTVEVVGDDFTMKNCKVYGATGSCIYHNDNAYDTGTNTSSIGSYEFSGNYFEADYAWNVSSGSGWNNGSATNRKITGNTFVSGRAICFTGKVAEPNYGWQWRLYPVGAATITGNDFTGCAVPVVCRGDVYEDLNWAQIWSGNTFDKAVIAGANAPTDCSPDNLDANYPNRRQISASIQSEVARATAGDTVLVAPGTYAENVDINKAITLKGENKSTTFVNGTGAGWMAAIYIQASDVTVQGFTITANGKPCIETPYAAGVSDCTITDNVFAGTAGQLVYINNTSGTGAGTNVDVTANLFSGSVNPGGLPLGHEAHNSAITGNVFQTSSTHATMEIWGSGNDLSDNDLSAATGMGLLLQSQTANVDLGASKFGAGLTEFIRLSNSPKNVNALGCTFGGTSTPAEIEAKVWHKADDANLGWVLYHADQVLGNILAWDKVDQKFYLTANAGTPSSGTEVVSGKTYYYGGQPLVINITGVNGDKQAVVAGASATNALRVRWYMLGPNLYRAYEWSTIGASAKTAVFQRGQTYIYGEGWQSGFRGFCHTISNGPTWDVAYSAVQQP